ncbi:MAG: carbohydrate ABC transporter permease [Ardenticatenaceae bacterium]|nr:carbohydrate ABC transporter permease [Ardenticatenaceae bacterium]
MSAQTPTLDSPRPVYSTGYVARKMLRLLLNYIGMIILALFFIFPIVFMLVTSIKTDENQILHDVSGLTAFVPYGPLGVENFKNVFERMNFGRFMFNSVLIVGTMVLVGLFVNSLAAYALARMRWKGRALVVAIVVALIIIPFEAVAIPLLLLVNRFGWLDTYHVQIIPFIADAFSIFLFYQFFIGLLKDLEEAALVDGAGRLRIYWNIIVPLSRPVFATVAILQFLFHWGDYMWPLMVTRGESVRPLMIGMQQFFGQYPRLWGDIMAFAAMITIPVLVVFLLFQRWFVQSVASAGVKGG